MISDCFALTLTQQDIYFDQLHHQTSPLYNVGGYIRLSACQQPDAALDIQRLQRAHHALVMSEDAFAIRVHTSVDGVSQYLSHTRTSLLPLLDFSASTDGQIQAESYLKTLFETALDIDNKELFRAALLKISDDEYWYIGLAHHMIMDGWGFTNWARRLGQFYQHRDGQTPASFSFKQVAHQDSDYLLSKKYQVDRDYWLKASEAQPDRLLSPNYSGEHNPGSARHMMMLDGEKLSQIKQLASDYGLGLSQLFLATFAIYFSAIYRKSRLAFGVPLHNRRNFAQKQAIGVFVSVSPLFIDIADQGDFIALVNQVAKSQLASFRHQRCPFAHLVKDSRGDDSSDLYEVRYNYLQLENSMAIADCQSELVYLSHNHESTPLTITVWEYSGKNQLAIKLDHNLDYFSPADMRQLELRVDHLLNQIIAIPQQPLCQLEVIPKAEFQQIERYGSGSEVAIGDCVHQLFARQAKAMPNNIAAVFNERSISYQQLATQSSHLAAYLAKSGIKPGAIVGLYTQRSIGLLVSLLAILKAGAAYLPLDPGYPHKRLAFMIDDSGIDFLLTDQQGAKRFATADVQTIVLDDADVIQAIQSQSSIDELPQVTANQLAYVIYTSGSTGQPKGVMIEHHSAVNLLNSMAKKPGFGQHDHLLAVTPVSFDIHVPELFLPLSQGGTVEICARDVSTDAEQLINRLQDDNITHLQATPATWKMLLAAPGSQSHFAIHAWCGGEALSDVLAQALAAKCLSVWNMYGPTETTVWSSCHLVNGQERSVPLGQPLDNTQLYVLDKHNQPLPIGHKGELFIGGAGVARGYLNHDELTNERFIPNPFGVGRLYRTGDLVNWTAQGQLKFLGRIDHQVKIRGYRVELSEIEAILKRHEQVQDAAVIWSEPAQQLIAYLVCEQHNSVVDELRQHLHQRLPSYMIPTGFAFVAKMPLTANDKIDYLALSTLGLPLFTHTECIEPASQTERDLCQIWLQLLSLDKLGVTENFFEIGGHSLLAGQLVNAIHRHFSVALSIKTIFSHQSIRTQAQYIDQAEKITQQSIAKVPQQSTYPLSFAQQRLWLMDQIAPGNSQYNMPGAIKLDGQLQFNAIQQALNVIVQRHEVLRTGYQANEAGQIRQFIRAEITIHLGFYDISALEPQSQTAQLAVLSHEEAHRAFDLAEDLMLRASIVALAPQQHILLITLHHIAADGWSMELISHELSVVYSALVQQQSYQLPPLLIQYKDYADWQNQQFSGELLQPQLDYWRERLAGIPAIHQLPLDKTRPKTMSYQGQRFYRWISEPLSAQLSQVAQRYDATLFMLLNSVFSCLLGYYSGAKDIVVGTPIANRNQSELTPLIGFFVNSLVIRTQLSDDCRFVDLLAQSKTDLLEAYNHQQLSFEQIVDELQPQRELSHHPVFQIVFALHNNQQHKLALEGLDASPVAKTSATAKFDITLEAQPIDGRLQLSWEFATDIFTPETITKMAERFEAMLACVVLQPEQKIGKLALLTTAEQHQLDQFNLTQHDFADNQTIAGLFEQQVKRSPDAIALVFGDEQLSYAQVNRRANRLAHFLIDQGVKPDSLVGLYLHRSSAMVIAIMAVLKAGGGYLPLVPDLPTSRLQYMLDDAAVSVVLSDESLSSAADFTVTQLFCLSQQQQLAQYSEQNPTAAQTGVNARHLAYVIYTSGSTGQPKGVMTEHRALVNRLDWMQQQFALTAADSILQKTPFGFDVSVWEFIWPLLNGARLVVAKPQGHKDPLYLAQLIRSEQISCLHFVPSMLNVMLQVSQWQGCDSVRHVICSGEALNRSLQDRFFALANDCQLHNLYGPTEAAIDVSYFQCDAHSILPVVPIGQPINNLRLYVLDNYHHQVACGVAGELYIGGVGLARGYLNNPELTAQQFIADPFSPDQLARLYRTGDRVRRLADGHLVFIERIDHQVKLRGFRIELSEIEINIMRHHLVREAVVMLNVDDNEQARLAAYIVPESTKADDAQVTEAHVGDWMNVFDSAYADDEQPYDFDISGWLSSFTGEQISAAQMSDWVSHIVALVVDCQPRHIYEIGCGSGLLLYRLLEHCHSYTGIDLSQTAVQRINQTVADKQLGNAQVYQGSANDFSKVAGQAIDTVLINSVAQYFPDIDYLEQVIVESIKLIGDKGRIIIGDVLNFALIEHFYSDVLRYQADEDETLAQLINKVQYHCQSQSELLIAPEFFRQLPKRYASIREVKVMLKTTDDDNEMSRYRYEVVLDIDLQAPVVTGVEVNTNNPIVELDWSASDELDRQIQQVSKQQLVIIRNIPNHRLLNSLDLSQLKQVTEGESLGVLAGPQYQSEPLPESLHIRHLANRCQAAGLDFQISDAMHSGPCYVDLWLRGAECRYVFNGIEAVETQSDSSQWFSEPMQADQRKAMLSALKQYLVDELPEYMLPERYNVVDEMPLTVNGKVDRRALAKLDITAEQVLYVAPESELEQQLCQLFESLLGQHPLGATANFFSAGGHSLLAARLSAAIEQQWQVSISIRDIFEQQTVRALAQRIETSEAAAPSVQIQRKYDTSSETEIEEFEL